MATLPEYPWTAGASSAPPTTRRMSGPLQVVMVQVKSIAEMGAYVSLLEYGNIEGMILLSELSRRRIRSVQKLIKVGRQEPVMVLRVDKDKGYIDLSKRRVSPEDVAVSGGSGSAGARARGSRLASGAGGREAEAAGGRLCAGAPAGGCTKTFQLLVECAVVLAWRGNTEAQLILAV